MTEEALHLWDRPSILHEQSSGRCVSQVMGTDFANVGQLGDLVPTSLRQLP